MSIQRIESAYAYCLDKKIKPSEMSVLIGLAYCANATTGACFPSDPYIGRLVHVAASTVQDARNRLRNAGIIDWVQRKAGNNAQTSNSYRFLFPMMKLKSARESYQQVVDNSASQYTISTPPPPHEAVPPTPADGVPPPRQMVTNTENKKKKNTSSFPSQPKYVVDRHTDQESSIQWAMRICNVDDMRNRKTFSHYMVNIPANDLHDLLEGFEDSLRKGELKTRKSPAAYLTDMFKKMQPANSDTQPSGQQPPSA